MCHKQPGQLSFKHPGLLTQVVELCFLIKHKILIMTQTISKSRLWTSRIFSGLVILFMLFDSIFKLIPNDQVEAASSALGYSAHHVPIIGILGLSCIILYAIPRTAILGAILLTGYFGGVVATHLRLDNPLFSHTLFSVYLAILAWGGLWLRSERLRKLFPLVTPQSLS
jgi:hypothetical protein